MNVTENLMYSDAYLASAFSFHVVKSVTGDKQVTNVKKKWLIPMFSSTKQETVVAPEERDLSNETLGLKF
ncbi:hypothetical protein ACJIZ3_012071 [Penstemon smallii]|uniref:Uncharacterized protein n=1 Tax=Penstemon smallii TaxID=265156 RepID=A0ABD3UKY8_9LAMI